MVIFYFSSFEDILNRIKNTDTLDGSPVYENAATSRDDNLPKPFAVHNRMPYATDSFNEEGSSFVDQSDDKKEDKETENPASAAPVAANLSQKEIDGENEENHETASKAINELQKVQEDAEHIKVEANNKADKYASSSAQLKPISNVETPTASSVSFLQVSTRQHVKFFLLRS
jgi:hypothetical protein